MIEALKSANAQAIQDGTLADLLYDRNEIMEVLDQRFPNSRTDTGDVTRQEGILFTKCGKG